MPAAALPRTRKRAVLAALAASALIVPYGALVTDFLTPYQEVPAPYYPPLVSEQAPAPIQARKELILLKETNKGQAELFTRAWINDALDLWSSKSGLHRQAALSKMDQKAQASYKKAFPSSYEPSDTSTSATPRLVFNNNLVNCESEFPCDDGALATYRFCYDSVAIAPESKVEYFQPCQFTIVVKHTKSGYRVTAFEISSNKDQLVKFLANSQSRRARHLNEKAVALYINAMQKAHQEKLKEAITLFDEALSLEPNFPSALQARAFRRSRLNDIKGAIADNTRAIELDPKFAHAYYFRALDKDFSGDYKGSICDLSKLAELDSNYPSLYLDRGLSYRALRDYKNALADFDRSIERDNQGSKCYAHFYKAWIYHHMPGKDDSKALTAIDSAIALNPNQADFFNFRGWVKYMSLNDLYGSIEDQNQAIKLDPNFGKAYIERGFVYRRTRDFEQSISDLTTGLQLSPDDEPGFLMRGKVFELKGDLDSAIADFTRASKLAVKFPEKDRALPYKLRGQAYLKALRFKEGFEDVTHANKLDPGCAESFPIKMMTEYLIESYVRTKKAFHTHNKIF
ncbi:MAG: hypothetical protein KC652_23770 [Cyanobacteria bacterium HKST-UBA01]|nr:hypothetical protein [Cyanobacteria bacterium HKST-UBA01]